MFDSENDLFELIRISLGYGNRSFIRNENSWNSVYDLSCKLGVSAIACDGLQRLTNIDIDEELYYKWIGQSLVKESDFLHHVKVLRYFSSSCAEAGIKVFVLKGLAFGVNYPVPSHRPCGDIDVFCVKEDGTPAYQDGNDVARQIGAEVDTSWYKHSAIYYDGVLIENHDYLVVTREGRRYKELNRDLIGLLLLDKSGMRIYDTSAVIPSPYFNALFQAYHSCGHFLAEGIDIKHILDWATFLQKEKDTIDWKRFYEDCKKYHLKRFVVAMTDIAVHKLGVEINSQDIEANSPYAVKVLNSILYDDAKVFSAPGGDWNHRVRLVWNSLKFRWKYKEIAQESFLRHIFVSIWGFFFHTEDD